MQECLLQSCSFWLLRSPFLTVQMLKQKSNLTFSTWCSNKWYETTRYQCSVLHCIRAWLPFLFSQRLSSGRRSTLMYCTMREEMPTILVGSLTFSSAFGSLKRPTDALTTKLRCLMISNSKNCRALFALSLMLPILRSVTSSHWTEITRTDSTTETEGTATTETLSTT